MSRFRFPRRLRFTRAGTFFTVGTMATGGAAIHSGNNLLFLLVGAMLGLIAANGWFSERALRGLVVTRTRTPSGPAGEPTQLGYRVENRKRRLPTVALRIREAGLPGEAFVSYLTAGSSVETVSNLRFERRGVVPLGRVVLETRFPFGLFRKERDIHLAGEVLVWPRRAGNEEAALAAAEQDAQTHMGASSRSLGARAEFVSLRDYRPGDEVRDIHWASTAKRGQPIVREFEGERGRPRWLCVDTRTAPGPAAEAMLERAAAVALGFHRRDASFGFLAPPFRIAPGKGRSQVVRVLEAMARIEFSRGGPALGAELPSGALVMEAGEVGR